MLNTGDSNIALAPHTRLLLLLLAKILVIIELISIVVIVILLFRAENSKAESISNSELREVILKLLVSPPDALVEVNGQSLSQTSGKKGLIFTVEADSQVHITASKPGFIPKDEYLRAPSRGMWTEVVSLKPFDTKGVQTRLAPEDILVGAEDLPLNTVQRVVSGVRTPVHAASVVTLEKAPPKQPSSRLFESGASDRYQPSYTRLRGRADAKRSVRRKSRAVRKLRKANRLKKRSTRRRRKTRVHQRRDVSSSKKKRVRLGTKAKRKAD